jgi:peroxiredoxin
MGHANGAAARRPRDMNGETTAMPEVGDVAPDFALRTSRGEEVRLSGLQGRQRALLVFYPKDKTTG